VLDSVGERLKCNARGSVDPVAALSGIELLQPLMLAR
jgi:hypothetical protein